MVNVEGTRVVGLAAGDPMDARTFSGLSRRVLTTMADAGVDVLPMSSRLFRAVDLVSGAPNWRGWSRGAIRGRRAPRINPNWYWSRRGFERFSLRVDRELSHVTADAVLQIGTHVRVSRAGVPASCLTDATVVQAIAADAFSVSRASARTVQEAVECQREVFDCCERVFVLSQWTANSVITDYGVPAERVHVIGAGANVIGSPAATSAGERGRRLLFVGLDWEQKGGPLVLEAFRLARQVVPDLELVVVGCTPSVRLDGVRVLGPWDPRDPETSGRLAALYADARAFAIAPAFDAFPNVLLEAAAAGAPVISTDRGSRPEAVLHGETGLLSPHGDAQAMAAHLVTVMTDDAVATSLGDAAAARVRRQFTWPVVVSRLMDRMGVQRATSA